jgi:hypothetical protein
MMLLSVDVTRFVTHNEKPPTAVKAARGLSLTKRTLGGCSWCPGSEQTHHKQPPSSGQGGFCHG